MNEKTVIINIGELKNQAINMLKEVKDIFDKYGLEYWLDFGSLLGAVREGKMIPWDCEFDLGVFYSNINLKSTMWDEIRSKGYVVFIDDCHMKIKRRDWYIGAFYIDLGIYKHMNEYVIYTQGHVSKFKMYTLLVELNNIFDCIISSNKKITYYLYNVYKILMQLYQNNVSKINKSNIKFTKGKYNNSFSFILENEDFVFVSDPSIIGKTKIRRTIRKVILNILEKLPKNVCRNFYQIINKIIYAIDNINHKYVIIIKYPSYYFKNFSKIKFYDMVFNAPSHKEKYLCNLYGRDWKIPNSKWNTITDSTAYSRA